MANPIIQRELIGMLRTRRALAIQLGLVAALAGLVLLRWPSQGRVDVAGSQAQQVLGVFGYGLMAGLILLVPIFPATSIVSERRRGTLALLLNSPMTGWRILAGKLVAAVGYVALLLVLSLPAAAACYAMGGVEAAGLGGPVGHGLRLYGVLGLLALMYAALGLLVSTYARTSESALRITYAMILLLAVGVILPHQFLQGQLTGPAAALVDWLRCLSPIPAMMELLGDTAIASGGLAGRGGAAGRFMLLAALASIAFAAWTGLRLNQRMLDTPRPAGQVTEERSKQVQAYRRIMYLGFFDPASRSGGIAGPPVMRIAVALALAVAAGTGAMFWFTGVDFDRATIVQTLLMVAPGVAMGLVAVIAAGAVLWLAATLNPVTVKEQKTSRFGRSHWMIRLIVACVIVSLGLMYLTTLQLAFSDLGTLGGIMVLLQVALILLLTPTLASGLISVERESRGWELLQMTPLSATSIVAGKLVSVLLTLLLLLAATLPGYLVLLAVDPGQMGRVMDVLTTLLLIAAMALLVSAALSSLCKRTATATTLAYCVLIGLCAGTLLVWLGENAPFSSRFVETVLTINPLAAALSLIEAPGFADYNLVPANWWAVGGLCVLSLGVLIVQTCRLTRPQ